MANNYFQFKEFTVYQDQCAMKVGTDGVLLGAWANLHKAECILDIGTGTGLIALMMAQRSIANIDAIELESSAFQQAKENIGRSRWNDRIRVICESFQKFSGQPNSGYDIIITNPPYFVNSHKTPHKKRTTARHNETLDFDDILGGTKKLLKEQGRFNLILPNTEAMQFIEKASDYNLFCTRRTYVKPTPKKPPKRVLMEFNSKKKPLTEDYLVIENNKRHHFTEDYRTLTKSYYLYF